MAADPRLLAWVAEAAEPLGRVTHRAMMGSATLYGDGTVFAIVADDLLWFKADAASDAEWDAAGCPRFTYTRADGSTAGMNYRRAPDEVYDDADAPRRRAVLALAAGARAPRRRPKGRVQVFDPGL